MLITTAPNASACLNRFGLFTSGLVPTNISTSADMKGSRPAAQPPRRSNVTHLADWSIVIVEKNEFEPSAASQAGSMVLAVWLL